MINSLSESIVKNRTFTLMSCVAFVLAMAYGIPNIKIGNDFKTYFDVEYPPLVAYESIQEEFSESENILVAIEVLDGDIFERETLVAIDKMTEALWKTPHSVRVDSVTNFQNTFVMGDLLETEALFDHRENLSDESLVERKNIALSEQLLKSTLISPDGKATGISVSMSFPDERDYQSTIESVSYVRDLVETWEHDYPGLRFRLVGEPMLNIAFAETSAQDSMTLFPLMFGVILVFLGFTFRSIVGVVSTSIVIIFSVMAALGLVGWLGVRLTPDGISAVAMILPIAVADCVHIINTYLKGLSLGLKKIEAIRRSLTENMQAVALTTVTTGLGFLSLNFSESPPIQMMGTTVAFGVIVAGILSLTLLPVMLLWMPTKGVQKKESFRWLSRFGKFVIAKDRTLFNVIILITLVLGGVGVSMNKLDETILNYFSTDTQFRQDVDWVDENLTGVTRVEVLLKSHSEDGISSVAYLKHLDNFATWLRSRDEVVSVSVFSDIVKKLNQTMNQGDNGFYRIPASNVLASQYVLLYELSLPYGLGLTNQVNLGKTASRATIQLTKLSDQETIVFDQAVQNWLRDHTPKSMWSSVAGPSVMFAYQLESNVRSVLGGLVLVLVAISLIHNLLRCGIQTGQKNY